MVFEILKLIVLGISIACDKSLVSHNQYLLGFGNVLEGEETLELPIGTVQAVQLQRLPRRDYDQKAQVWLAPELGYLPVRIRITQTSGDFAELSLRSRATP